MQTGSKWYHVQLLMIGVFLGNETFLNLKLNNAQWKWNGYGTFFHPIAEVGFGPKGVFVGCALPLPSSTSCRGHLEHVDEGDGIWDVFAVHFVFFLLRSDCFVCLFLIPVAGNSYGEMGYRISGYISVQLSLYLSHILWLCRRCILYLSFQNSLAARQW